MIGATFAFCWGSDSESSFVSAQEITATRARVGHLVCKNISQMAGKLQQDRKVSSVRLQQKVGDEIKRGAGSQTCCMLSTQQGMQAQGQNPKIDIYQSVLKLKLNLLNQE